ncbi:hypothetical protein [Arenimonas fontis]|uniref:Uncharacterized protein n=1 Tax=Arenimonas fontis TaxID=2608255 RepID=A0A5B2ZBW6_9GAMM|nr:hypothetical protein [Arenimonas fontis]KAA2285616.1 hypothetical protein F0415_02960 [Arenimonas fontis]
MRRSFRRPLRPLAALLLLAAAVAAAQAPRPNVIRLEPKPMAGVDRGKAVVVKGRAGAEPHRFMLDSITYMQPVAVALRPVRRGERVDLSITKYAWNRPLRQGNTDGDILRYGFRTEGEFQVSVSAPQPGTDYRLLVWVGDETKPDFAPVVVKASGFGQAGAGSGSPVPWVIAAVLAGILALLAVLAFRRKSS